MIHPEIETRLEQRQAPATWTRRILFTGLLVLASRRAAAADAPGALPLPAAFDFRNPPQGVFDDQWKEVFLGGEKIGYEHQFFRRVGDTIFNEQHFLIRVGRQDSVLEMKGVVQSEETLSGEARSFHSETELASAPKVVDGKGDGKTFDVTMQTGNYHEEKQVTFPPGTLLAWGEERLARTKGTTPGTSYDFLSYDPSDDPFSPLPTKETVGPSEKLNIHGQTIETARIVTHVSSTNGIGGTDSTTWVDAADRTIRSTVSMGGMTMESDVATKEQALADFLPKDIFSATLMPLNELLPADAASVTLRLSRRDNQPLPLPPESYGEHSEVLPDGSVRMTLTHAGGQAASSPPIKDLAPYLARNSFLDTSDPVLRKLAMEGGGEATSPLAMAHNLRKFVADYITKKDLSVGFATASETAQSHEGDCTEHAVLLAALGRIRGVPTRVVAGLVFMPEYEGQSNILGFHMWTQFYINSQWVDYDSAVTDGAHPYWRLGFVATDLDDVSLSDFSMDLMSWMSEMKITVEKATPSAGN